MGGGDRDRVNITIIIININLFIYSFSNRKVFVFYYIQGYTHKQFDFGDDCTKFVSSIFFRFPCRPKLAYFLCLII